MNLGTLVEKVMVRTKRRAAKDRGHVLDAFEETMRTLRDEEWWFNRRTTSFNLMGSETPRDTEDPSTGGFPVEMIRIIEARVPGRQRPLRPSSPEEIRRQTDIQATLAGPQLIAMENDLILAHPEYVSEIFLAYIADIGTPVVSFESGKFVVRLIDKSQLNGMSVTVVTDAYTNAWFIEAMNLLVNETLYNLWMGPYANSAKAQRAQMQVGKAYTTLKKRNSRFAKMSPRKAWL